METAGRHDVTGAFGSTTRVYRLAHLDGSAPERPFRPSASANRWNSGDTALAYAASSVSLCALEILASWDERSDLQRYELFAFDLDDEDVLDVRRTHPELDLDDPRRTRSIGDAWARQGVSLALRVPSTVVPFEDNVLINPGHPRFDDDAVVRLGAYVFDDRLIGLVDAARRGHEARSG